MNFFRFPVQLQLLISTVLGPCLGLEFTGLQGQWARYLRWDASTKSDLSFQFKTDVSTALILYFDDGGFCDFLQLMVVEGKLQLQLASTAPRPQWYWTSESMTAAGILPPWAGTTWELCWFWTEWANRVRCGHRGSTWRSLVTSSWVESLKIFVFLCSLSQQWRIFRRLRELSGNWSTITRNLFCSAARGSAWT